MPTDTGPGFGRFLRADEHLLAAYREWTGRLLADMPRLVTVWRAEAGSEDRDGFSVAEARSWLLGHSGCQDDDFADLRTFAAIWAASRA